MLLTPQLAFAAIAFDNAANSGFVTSATPTISSMVLASGNSIVVATYGNFSSASEQVTSMTCNGNAMTKIAGATGIMQNGNTPDGFFSTFYIVGCTGTQNIVANLSASQNGKLMATSYTGVDQVTPIAGSNLCANAANTLSNACTVSTGTVNNAWAVSGIGTGGPVPAATAPLTGRAATFTTAADDFLKIGDSNAAITPAGNYTATWTFTSVQNAAWIVAIAPAAAAVAQPTSILGLIQALWW